MQNQITSQYRGENVNCKNSAELDTHTTSHNHVTFEYNYLYIYNTQIDQMNLNCKKHNIAAVCCCFYGQHSDVLAWLASLSDMKINNEIDEGRLMAI